MNFLLILVVLFGIMMIFTMSRSNKRRQAQAQQLQSALTAGAQVRTIGGLLGDVVEVTDEHVVIETTPGVKLKFAKNAIAGVSQPAEPEAEGAIGAEGESEAGAEGEDEPQDEVTPFEQARAESPFAAPRAGSDSETDAASGPDKEAGDEEIDAALDPQSESANR